MKFRDGYWNIKPNVRLLPRISVVDVHSSADKLTVYSTTKKIEHRGSTLNAPLLTMEISSPRADILHIRSYHFKGTLDLGPRFDVLEDRSDVLSFEEDDASVTVSTGDLSVRIDRTESAQISFSYRNEVLTTSPSRMSGHAIANGTDQYQFEYLGLSVGEMIYGLGERFTPFVKNGQVVDIWNEDGGTSSEQAYKNVPFYLSSKGYGVFVANPGDVSFEVGTEVVSAVQFAVRGECLDYYIIGGRDLKEVVANYTNLTGRPALVPPWSFGLWLTTSFTTTYDEKTVTSFVEGMKEREIPLHVFHFDCFWMREFQWVDFSWDQRQFPNPPAMIKRLHDRGLKICVWINPYVAQKSPMFDEGMKGGYLVKNPDGSVWQWDRWQAGMGLVDFTNPEAADWYRRKLKALLDMGVDCFKTDFGERIPTDVVYHDGSDPIKMHNYYTYRYNEAVFTLLQEERGSAEAVVFARSATAGGQKFPVHWGGDCSATYESMAESLRGGLSLSLCGFGYWSHDIGGFEQTATADLFKRWVAFGLLSTHSRLHGNESYRVPWNYDDESSEVLKAFTELKCSLMPYLFSKAVEAHQQGIPMMRAMVMEFNDDPICQLLDRQYMLGDSLLVAPIFNDVGQASYYLPEGRWSHLLSNEEVVGGKYQWQQYDYFSLPLFVRPNTLLAIGSVSDRPDYDYGHHPTFHLFALDDAKTAQALLHAPDGALLATCTANRRGKEIVVTLEGTIGDWALCLRNIERVASVTQGKVLENPLGITIECSEGEQHLIILLDE